METEELSDYYIPEKTMENGTTIGGYYLTKKEHQEMLIKQQEYAKKQELIKLENDILGNNDILHEADLIKQKQSMQRKTLLIRIKEKLRKIKL